MSYELNNRMCRMFAVNSNCSHFKVDDMAKVGSTLVDIDIQDTAEADSSLAKQDDKSNSQGTLNLSCPISL